ncbi:FtsK/SpoIIIE domain-containing protein, partial [Neisseria sicca]|uniref:FtsK/SpoIIIE domain-containing protein n=1 Tax=Neisseria sicca TaxID=490 RepID=UPI0034D96219
MPPTPLLPDFAKIPHLFLPPITPSPKSLPLNPIIISILFKPTPHQLLFIIIHPKIHQFTIYHPIPHLLSP